MHVLMDIWTAVFDKAVARPLSNSEALQVLNQTQQMRKDDDASYVPTPMVQQAKQYLERFNTVKSIPGIENMQQLVFYLFLPFASHDPQIWPIYPSRVQLLGLQTGMVCIQGYSLAELL